MLFRSLHLISISYYHKISTGKDLQDYFSRNLQIWDSLWGLYNRELNISVLLTLPEHLRSPLVFGGVRVVYSLVFYVVSCVLLFVCLSFSFVALSVSFRFTSLTVPLVSFVPLLCLLDNLKKYKHKLRMKMNSSVDRKNMHFLPLHYIKKPLRVYPFNAFIFYFENWTYCPWEIDVTPFMVLATYGMVCYLRILNIFTQDCLLLIYYPMKQDNLNSLDHQYYFFNCNFM